MEKVIRINSRIQHGINSETKSVSNYCLHRTPIYSNKKSKYSRRKSHTHILLKEGKRRIKRKKFLETHMNKLPGQLPELDFS